MMNPQWKQVALASQLIYIGMSIFWNLVGIGLIDAGLKPLGPVANLQTVYLLLAVAILLVIGSGKSIKLYFAMSALLAVGALSALHGSVTGAADLWPSAYFRWFGALINVHGFLAFGLASFVSFKTVRPKS